MKKAIVILVPVLLIGGVGGAAFMGVIKIPGITPKAKLAANLYGEGTDLYAPDADTEVKIDATVEPIEPAAPPVAKKPEAEPEEPEPVLDPELGAKKLAKVWNALSTEDLMAVSATFKDDELALVLSKMEVEKVAALVGEMEPKRGASVSRQLARIASVVPEES